MDRTTTYPTPGATLRKYFRCSHCDEPFLTRRAVARHERKEHGQMNDLTALRGAIEAERQRRALVDAACTRTRFASAAEAVSMSALASQYPQVARLRSAALAEAEMLELLSDGLAGLFASTAKFMLECAGRLREACK